MKINDGMTNNVASICWLRTGSILSVFISIVLLGMSMNASALFDNTVNWKEEVVLHDGSKLIAKRSHTYSDHFALGSRRPVIVGRSIEFNVPGESQNITWQSDKSQRFLNLLVLDIKDGIPYLATNTGGCATYNEFGRPNPPYLFYKYDHASTQWKRIPVEEFPQAFTRTNLMEAMGNDERSILEEDRKQG